MTARRTPLGFKLLSVFFGFGAAMCLLTIAMLLFPGGPLEPIWRLNPDTHLQFQKLGRLSILLMSIVGAACALTSIGLAKRARWGVPLALAILSVNVIGDLLNAIFRHDLRTLIGLPISGAMIVYLLMRRRVLNQDPEN